MQWNDSSPVVQSARRIAERLRANIVSLDSMKVYRGMDAGTAKPTAEELARVPYLMLSFLDPSESNSMGQFLDRAEATIRDLDAKGIPVVCEGGSIMYVKGLVEGVFKGPARNAEVRKALKEQAMRDGVPALHAKLKGVDPLAAEKIGPNDYKRIERALEVWELSGTPISSLQTQWGKRREDFDFRLAGLRWERKKLYERINLRADAMLKSGWIDECRALLNRPLSPEALMAHGYRAVFAHLRGEISYNEMLDWIRKDTRHYARRQMSWFGKFPGMAWVDADESKNAEQLADEVLAAWESQKIIH